MNSIDFFPTNATITMVKVKKIFSEYHLNNYEIFRAISCI